MSQEEDEGIDGQKPKQQQQQKRAPDGGPIMRPPESPSARSRKARDLENPLSKRSRQRNNKRNKIKQHMQQQQQQQQPPQQPPQQQQQQQQQKSAWKQAHYGNNRHKNNGANNAAKNNNKEDNNKAGNNIRSRRAFFVNTTFTMGRKRAMTFPSISKFFLPYKRPRKESIIPPTKFLLGGNISDPLNLNSLHDDDGANATEPLTSEVDAAAAAQDGPRDDDKNKSLKEENTAPQQQAADENSTHNSQQQTHQSTGVCAAPAQPRLRVQVIVPPNMFDPLNLLHPLEDRAEYEKQLTSPVKKKSRNRNNRKRKSSKALNTSGEVGNNSSSSNPDYSTEMQDSVTENTEDVKSAGEPKNNEAGKVAAGQADESTSTSTSTVVSTSTTSSSGCVRDLKLDLGAANSKNSASSKDAGGCRNKRARMDSMDKIVSPVIPQPGAWMRPHRVDRGGQRGRGRGRGGRGSNNSSYSSFNNSMLSNNTSVDVTIDATDVSMTTEQPSTAAGSDTAPVCVPEEAEATCDKTETADSKKDDAGNAEKPKEDEAPRLPKFKKDGRKYQYGNYDRYYGYRNLNESMDVRLKVFQMHGHLFAGRDVLDVGCNVGHVALCVARDLGAKTVTGIDIDGKLIDRAKKNLRQHVAIHRKQQVVPAPTATTSQTGTEPKPNTDQKSDDRTENPGETCTTDAKSEETDCDKPQYAKKTVKIAKPTKVNNKRKKNAAAGCSGGTTENYFPVSFPLLYGPIDVLDNEVENRTQFPYNVVFKHTNYVLKDDGLVSAEPARFDLIMCLSVTKWLHLNYGDAGLKRAFKRMFAQLRPGGKLILEAQNWASYKKKKNLTETIYNNYRAIEFFPCKFRDYLLSPEVGFSQCSVLGVPQHLSKGFRRPVQLYVKGDFTPSQAMWSDTRMPSASHYAHQSGTPSSSARRPVYTAPVPDIRSGAMFSYWGSTPYSMASHHTNNIFDLSPFYAPGSGSYTPSYSEGHRNVYAPVGSRCWSPATSATPSQSPAPHLDTTPGATPDATPAHSGWTSDQVTTSGRGGAAPVYAPMSSGSDSAAGTPFHQSQSSPQYLSPRWHSSLAGGSNSNGGVDYYVSPSSARDDAYSPPERPQQEDTTSSNDEHQPGGHQEGSSTNSPPTYQDEECTSSVLNGHHSATSPSCGDCDSPDASPLSEP